MKKSDLKVGKTFWIMEKNRPVEKICIVRIDNTYESLIGTEIICNIYYVTNRNKNEIINEIEENEKYDSDCIHYLGIELKEDEIIASTKEDLLLQL